MESNYKEAHPYLVKYRHLQGRAASLVRGYVTHVLDHATKQVLAPKDEHSTDQETIDTAYAVYFGKFQAAAPKLQMVIREIEKRAEHNEDYASFLSDIQREYTARRHRVSGAPTAAALAAAARKQERDHCTLLRTSCSLLAHACRDECALYGHFFSQPSQALEVHLFLFLDIGVCKQERDHCTLLRTSCSLLAHACRDECALYGHFFSQPSQALDEYLQTLCNSLYETLRPHIIHINHLETLVELCVILRVEVIDEQANNDREYRGIESRV
ncbi:unnamed protein product [Plutella xylostella]|uniref:(diamondback moth) hypothetical protein n=1 Tax=Plutella xylostella TaxID=51655 RepID=A0A8S4EPU5_PLUXY|nr:unnamed protein product [Plutella xylostella]